MLRYLFLAHGTHLFLFYSPKAYHSRKGHVHDYGVKREKLSAKQEIWLFFDFRLRNGQSAQRRKISSPDTARIGHKMPYTPGLSDCRTGGRAGSCLRMPTPRICAPAWEACSGTRRERKIYAAFSLASSKAFRSSSRKPTGSAQT